MPDERWTVPADLPPWVDAIEVGTCAQDQRRPLVHVPDPATVLVWRIGADGSDSQLVMGPRTRAAYYESKDIPIYVRVRIAPGAAEALLGVAAGEIVDQVVAIELDGRPARHPATPAVVVERVVATLRGRIGNAPIRAAEPGTLVRVAAAGLSAEHGSARVGEVARRIGVGERQLRTAFVAATGLSPKRFASISRVRRVVAGSTRTPWAQLAGDTGYYDQSHMTAEFRELMRITPGDFAKGAFPTVPC